jgi:pimeloyl-ACP methyl ester carboxylesterase
MEVQELGQGDRAVLLLHGIPGSTQSFAGLVRRLSGHARLLIPAMPGYGTSSPIRPYDFARAQESLEEALIERGVEACAVVGHSGGTYRGLRLALDGEIEVTHLVLLGAIAGLDADGRSRFRELAISLANGADLVSIAREAFAAPGFSHRDPVGMGEILLACDACPRQVLIDELAAFADAEDLRSALGRIACPTHLRVGALDAATPPALSAEIAGRIPGSKLAIVPGCGHSLLQEDARETIEAIASAIAL